MTFGSNFQISMFNVQCSTTTRHQPTLALSNVSLQRAFPARLMSNESARTFSRTLLGCTYQPPPNPRAVAKLHLQSTYPTPVFSYCSFHPPLRDFNHRGMSCSIMEMNNSVSNLLLTYAYLLISRRTVLPTRSWCQSFAHAEGHCCTC